jgi:hypothetical protein
VFALSSSGSQSIFVSLEYYLCRLSATEPIRVRELQTALEAKLDELLPALVENGYTGEPEIEAKLQFSEAGVQAFFPEYSVIAILNVTDSPS